MIVQILSSFFAVVAASILLEAPKKLIYRAGFIGAAGWAVFLIFLNSFGPVQSTFIAGLVISTLSHIFSRVFKTPVTMFFIPGFYPLVPGYRMYMAVYNFIEGNGTLAKVYLVDTIKISGMIALAIFTIDTVFNVINKVKHLRPQD
jgi:uncharacterized membrane protein YjjB (DUF3815 family)